jgi:hypothetical protein
MRAGPLPRGLGEEAQAAAPPPHPLLALQQSIGNAAVSRLVQTRLQRQDDEFAAESGVLDAGASYTADTRGGGILEGGDSAAFTEGPEAPEPPATASPEGQQFETPEGLHASVVEEGMAVAAGAGMSAGFGLIRHGATLLQSDPEQAMKLMAYGSQLVNGQAELGEQAMNQGAAIRGAGGWGERRPFRPGMGIRTDS